MKRLNKIWEAVQDDGRQAVFIGGDPGSGKSRLAAEMARAVHGRDATVLMGTTSRELSYPYEPLVEVLDQLLVGTVEGDLADTIPDTAVDLTRLTRHLRRHRPDFPEVLPDEDEYRKQMFSAYVDLFRAVARERPVALVLEDLHWSSAPTRLLLSHLIEHTDDDPILILGTFRTTSPDRSEDLAYTIADLHRFPGVTRLDLGGLDIEDVEEYLTVEVGQTQHVREAAALLRDHTGGNPFFLRETCRELVEKGGLSAVFDRTDMASHSLRDTLRRRVLSLSDDTRRILEFAAVLGATFDVPDIAKAVGTGPGDVLSYLDDARDAGLLDVTDRGETWSFRHALVRQSLLDDLASSRSAEIHARLAKSIEERFAQESGLAPVLARLFAGTRALGYRDRTVFYLTEAAAAAHRSLAHEEAADFFEEAAQTVRGDTDSREKLLLSAARSRLLAGEFPEAIKIFRDLNDSENPRTALEAAIGFEEASWRPGYLGHQARSLLEISLDRIQADPTDSLYVAGRIALGRANAFSGDADRAERIGGEALDMARALGDDHLLADALVATLLRVISVHELDPNTYELALELRELVRKTGNYDRLGPAGAFRGLAGFLTSDRDAFDEGWQDINLAAAKSGQPFWEWVDGCYQYCNEFMNGQFARARATAIRINELGYTFGSEGAEGPYGIQMYMVERETGELEQVRGLLTGDPAQDGTWSPGLLSLYTELDMEQPARAMLAGSIDLARTMSTQDAAYPGVLAFLTEGALFLEDREVMERLLQVLSEFDGHNLIMGQCVAVFGSANTYLGRLLTSLGELEEAERNFRKALKMDITMRSIVHQANTLAHYARLLELMDEADRAVDYRSRASLLAEPIGQRRVLRLVETRDESHPDGLSPREIEVLGLLAAGASNKEIGEKLFISPNTAANHVRSILVKTGASNRTAAAAYAAERGLV